MAIKTNNTTICISSQTYTLLQTIQSCLQLVSGKKVTYNDIIQEYLLAGLKESRPEILQIMDIIKAKAAVTKEQDNDQDA